MSFQTNCRQLLILLLCCLSYSAWSQVPVTGVDPELENLFTQSPSREYIIDSVTVTGNQYFDNNLLLSVAGLQKGTRVNIPGGDQFSRAINQLWSQNYFSNVAIYVTGLRQPNFLTIEIEVTERPRLQRFTFSGVRKSDHEELSTKTGLVAGRIVTENNKQLASEAIKNHYKEKGFNNVQVEVVEKPSATVPNALDLEFQIARGSKVRISDIFVGGNEKVSDLKIKRRMKGTKEMTRLTLYPVRDTPIIVDYEPANMAQLLEGTGFLKPTMIRNAIDPYFRFKLFSSAKFDPKKYGEDKESILDYYNSLGYRDSRILQDTIYANSEGNLNVEIKLSEGRRYYFGDLVFRGNTKYPDSLLRQVMSINKGDIYNKETLDKALGKMMTADGNPNDISALYMDDGYLFFQANATETAVYNDTIDHEIRIAEGPQATIKNVNIFGNDKTKEHVIRRELRTIPGEKFNRTLLIRSQREIANLGYFNQEKIGIEPRPNMADGTVDINYTVEEKSSDQLELSAGWGGMIGLTGTLGVSFNNFSINNIFKKSAWDPLPTGDGQKLSIRLQSNGRAYRSYNFSFTEPWLGGKKRNGFTVSFYDTKFANAFNWVTYEIERNPSSYIQSSGATVSLTKQLRWPDDYFSLMTAANYTRYRLKEYRFIDDFDNGISNNLNLRIALQRYSLDQQQFPRSGSNFTLMGQFTPPWSMIGGVETRTPTDKYKLIEYHKWRFTGEWYTPLSRAHGEEKNKQLVLKLAAKYGFMGRYNPDEPVSPFERFQVGGDGMSNQMMMIGYDIISHRGYPVYERSDPKINPDRQFASQYFTIFNKYTAEVRYPLSLNPSSVIYGLAFFEAANGWYDFKSYNPFQLRRSVGLGMRFFLPMFGLLGFDYGIGLDRMRPGQGLREATRFSFMLGFEPD